MQQARLPPHILPVDEPHIRLIDQLRDLQSVARAFASHVVTGQSMQLPVNEWNQLLESFRMAITPGLKQLRDVMSRGFGHRNPGPVAGYGSFATPLSP
jgi:hypothetical protein